MTPEEIQAAMAAAWLEGYTLAHNQEYGFYFKNVQDHPPITGGLVERVAGWNPYDPTPLHWSDEEDEG